jgi:hypothetical protein
MSISSTEGSITLSREWPHPSAIDDSQITGLRLFVNEQGFWTGDRVTLAAPGGLPFDILATGYANCPDGHGFWPGTTLGPAGLHRTDDAAAFFAASDAAVFFDDATTTGLTTSIDAYIRRDGLDRCTFYASEVAALNGGPASLLPLKPIEFGVLIAANRYDNAGYRALLMDAATLLRSTEIPMGQQPIDGLPLVKSQAAAIAAIADNTDIRGWKIQCDLTDILFDEDSGNLDMSAIGEEFGSSVAGIANGQGSFRGELGNKWAAGEDSAVMMLRLLRMKRKGAAATARIQIARSRLLPLLGEADDLITLSGDVLTTLSGDVLTTLFGGGPGGSGSTRQEFPIYYETKILFGKTSVGITAQQLTSFSGDFISTGEIKIVTDPIEA